MRWRTTDIAHVTHAIASTPFPEQANLHRVHITKVHGGKHDAVNPPKAMNEGLLESIVQTASRCRLEAMKITGESKWALLAMAEELEELDHELRAPGSRLPREAK